MVAPVCIMETPVTVVSTLASSSPDFCWSLGLSMATVAVTGLATCPIRVVPAN